MNKEFIEFEREKIKECQKLSDELFTDINIKSGIGSGDFVTGLTNMLVETHIYSNLSEERDLVYYCKRPRFFDWLLRRSKKVVFKLKVKDLYLNPPKVADSKRIYVMDSIYEDYE